MTLIGHLNIVRCVYYFNNPGLIASGSVDHTRLLILKTKDLDNKIMGLLIKSFRPNFHRAIKQNLMLRI